MSSNIKYIGKDVHKESISVAVRNAAGKIVMECVIETKANTILQFFDGLRGEVQVTFEEGTWAAWLHDLLKPHVGKLVVCDPRRNALLLDGNQNDRVDARKLSDLLYMNKLNAVYHGDHGLRTLQELVRSYLTITRDLGRVMTRVKAIYRSWAIPCSGKQVYGSRHRAEWLGKINEPGVRRRILLPTTGYLEIVAPDRAPRAARGEQEAQDLEAAVPDSVDRSDPSGSVAGHSADPAPIPHQATAVDLQRFGHRGAQQRRPRDGARPATTEEEESVQGSGSGGFDEARPVRIVLRGFSGQGHTPRNGAADFSQEDCHHCFACVEERGVLRRQSSETTNSLSVSDRVRSILEIFSGGGLWVLETPWFESESQPIS